MKKAELLVPAGSLSRLRTAILYGADAVYAGVPDLSLRANSEFSLESLIEGIHLTHSLNKKVYLTLNLFTHNADIAKLPLFIKTLRQVKPDGVIVSDPGVFDYILENAPELPLHISTQANVCSWLTVNFWQKMGAELCVLGREASFPEIQEIRAKCPDIRLEMFVHGAMCMSYSGRCLLSSFMAARPANKGKCAHSCRWKYKVYLEEEQRPGEFIPIEEDDKGTYLMNSKDLCLMPKLDQILNLGIDSLKIEGRHKSDYYVAMTARIYRKAIDDWYKDKENWNPKPYMDELATMQSRNFTLGFFDGMPKATDYNYQSTLSTGSRLSIGTICDIRQNSIIMLVNNRIQKGDEIEFLSPYQFAPLKVKITKVLDAQTGTELQKVSAGKIGQAIEIPFTFFQNVSTDEITKLLPVLSVARTGS